MKFKSKEVFIAVELDQYNKERQIFRARSYKKNFK